jgi:hypothetical protein
VDAIVESGNPRSFYQGILGHLIRHGAGEVFHFRDWSGPNYFQNRKYQPYSSVEDVPGDTEQ